MEPLTLTKVGVGELAFVTGSFGLEERFDVTDNNVETGACLAYAWAAIKYCEERPAPYSL
jgi:hypothetical protein